ncbi:MAG: flagellar hook assembly protein FlgD [Ilumatobacter sp.]|jgi:flagellar basal-body rod modification protein FlgD|uniref:flagellar hook assembly protein FlgD n=1 Tax=Ilumatobacter sp. TaxID=1967498 RepID=UPI00391C1919
MTDAIAPVASRDLGASAAPVAAPQNPGADLDRDAFLKLLVAQLRYQDPTNPTDPSAMMAQTSQLTMVERLQEISDALTAAAATDQLALAGSMVGREITFQSENGPTTGLVEAVRFLEGQFVLSAGGFAVPLTAVTEIRAGAPVAAASADPFSSSFSTPGSPRSTSW